MQIFVLGNTDRLEHILGSYSSFPRNDFYDYVHSFKFYVQNLFVMCSERAGEHSSSIKTFVVYYVQENLFIYIYLNWHRSAFFITSMHSSCGNGAMPKSSSSVAKTKPNPNLLKWFYEFYMPSIKSLINIMVINCVLRAI